MVDILPQHLEDVPPKEEKKTARRADIEATLSVISKLNVRQRRFTARVLLGETLADAYTIAYDYTGQNARRLGSKLRHNPKIQAAIDEYFHAQEMSAREALALLSDQARGTMADFIHFPTNEDGEDMRFLSPEIDLRQARDKEKLHLLKKYKTKRIVYTDKDGGETVTEWMDIELHDAQSALEKIGRYHGLFGSKGTDDDPLHTVGMSLDEWRAEQERQRSKAAETMDLFDNDDLDPGD